MKYHIKISKILDEYLPSNGVGTKRETLRMNLHREFSMLMSEMNNDFVEVKSIYPETDNYQKWVKVTRFLATSLQGVKIREISQYTQR